jgi:hypothetical protein
MCIRKSNEENITFTQFPGEWWSAFIYEVCEVYGYSNVLHGAVTIRNECINVDGFPAQWVSALHKFTSSSATQSTLQQWNWLNSKNTSYFSPCFYWFSPGPFTGLYWTKFYTYTHGQHLLPTSCFGLVFDPEDGDSTFLHNVGKLLPQYMASHHRRYHSSELLLSEPQIPLNVNRFKGFLHLMLNFNDFKSIILVFISI